MLSKTFTYQAIDILLLYIFKLENVVYICKNHLRLLGQMLYFLLVIDFTNY